MITIEGLGIANAVVLPVIVPTVTDMILVPGANEPPAVAAGTSVTTLKAPLASLMKPVAGIPLAPPKVRVDPVVLGGNPLPVTVTALPVEASAGDTVTTPFEITSKAVFVRLTVAAVAIVPVFRSDALSVTVIVIPAVAAGWSTGIVMTPVPDPSEPIGNVVVPVKVFAGDTAVTVNSALKAETSPISTVMPVTVIVTEPPGLDVVGERTKVRGVREKADEDLPTRPPLSVAVMVRTLLLAAANNSNVGILVA